MDAALIEQLLHEEEGPGLDFKRDQYAFVRATDEQKSEILKDILGFANAWRRSDAYILIGVQDVRGGRGQVVGVAEQLDDHSLQQFVNHLTNRPLRFQYEAVSIGGQEIAVIRIELQDRPFYLKRDFGKLRKGEVYVRRGSATDLSAPATPDEIMQMGRQAGSVTSSPEIAIEFADSQRNATLGDCISIHAELTHMPAEDELPDFTSYVGSDPFHALEAYRESARPNSLNQATLAWA